MSDMTESEKACYKTAFRVTTLEVYLIFLAFAVFGLRMFWLLLTFATGEELKDADREKTTWMILGCTMWVILSYVIVNPIRLYLHRKAYEAHNALPKHRIKCTVCENLIKWQGEEHEQPYCSNCGVNTRLR